MHDKKTRFAMNWLSFVKFILLTGWIVFISLTAYNFYKPDIWDQTRSVDDCLYEISKHPIDFRPERYAASLYAQDNAHGTVAFITNFDKEKQSRDNVYCTIRLKDRKVVSLSVGLRWFVDDWD